MNSLERVLNSGRRVVDFFFFFFYIGVALAELWIAWKVDLPRNLVIYKKPKAFVTVACIGSSYAGTLAACVCSTMIRRPLREWLVTIWLSVFSVGAMAGFIAGSIAGQHSSLKLMAGGLLGGACVSCTGGLFIFLLVKCQACWNRSR
ncbi:hypothetical protein BDQ17DRAFT_412731 [Cyathus striatus]|nr:hypothetical protein BDQ17DRAFT_412731 [Cyathus striatus]